MAYLDRRAPPRRSACERDASPERGLAASRPDPGRGCHSTLLTVPGIPLLLLAQLDGAYVGGTAAIPRLLVPSIHMQDAAQGFRTSKQSIVGEV